MNQNRDKTKRQLTYWRCVLALKPLVGDMKILVRTLLLFSLASSASVANAGIVFNLTPTGNASADAGFLAAANYIQSQFDDNVTINLTTAFSTLDPGILGSASSTVAGYGFGAWRTAMTGDSTSADDATMVANLPAGSTYSRWINNTSTNGSPHLNTGLNNVRLSNANAKALGLLSATAGAEDASIEFSDRFSWDFDQSDGIGAGLIDFVGVATHEIMHAMGFTSGVDILDINGTEMFTDAQFAPFVSGLDFTRQSAAAIAGGADLDWTVGTAAKDFSIDGGTTSLISNAFSTGVNFGDGSQASHWKDSLGIGIMDPTSVAAGSMNIVTAFDLQALDVIGWNQGAAVPEPSSFAVFGLGLIGFGGYKLRRRRKSTATNATLT
ncbi:MAG: NF038122 family metalloprotease [Fuerstiella sp.]